ncbi:leucine-rich repeat domain-containing protein [Stieleria varia]
MPLIGQLTNLRDLTLQFAEFSNESVRHLCGLRELENVDMRWSTISDKGLVHLSQISTIRSLKLNKSCPPVAAPNSLSSQITNSTLEQISKLKNLQTLVIWGADITDAGLPNLIHCDQLRTLWLCECDIEGPGLVSVAKLADLQELDLCGTDVSGTSLEPLQQLRGLRSLRVARTNVSPSDAATYQSRRQGDIQIVY